MNSVLPSVNVIKYNGDYIQCYSKNFESTTFCHSEADKAEGIQLFINYNYLEAGLPRPGGLAMTFPVIKTFTACLNFKQHSL